ncbi:MAG: hypothetical protein D6712_10455 [Chloroflexi bacterium]|nr:MAG: hypothetical protein D6712_10455 [Chloroflexota bacterium]
MTKSLPCAQLETGPTVPRHFDGAYSTVCSNEVNKAVAGNKKTVVSHGEVDRPKEDDLMVNFARGHDYGIFGDKGSASI